MAVRVELLLSKERARSLHLQLLHKGAVLKVHLRRHPWVAKTDSEAVLSFILKSSHAPYSIIWKKTATSLLDEVLVLRCKLCRLASSLP